MCSPVHFLDGVHVVSAAPVGCLLGDSGETVGEVHQTRRRRHSSTLRLNSREHLESLVESMDTGYASIQDYLADAVAPGKKAS